MAGNQFAHHIFVEEKRILSTFSLEVAFGWAAWLHNFFNDRFFQIIFKILWSLITRRRGRFFAARIRILFLLGLDICSIIASMIWSAFFVILIICVENRFRSWRHNHRNDLGLITVELLNFGREWIHLLDRITFLTAQTNSDIHKNFFENILSVLLDADQFNLVRHLMRNLQKNLSVLLVFLAFFTRFFSLII